VLGLEKSADRRAPSKGCRYPPLLCRSEAEEAAEAVGGKVLLPIFAPNENSYPTGLEEVTPQKFRTGQLSDRQQEALAKMKQYTDFNDLATKSVLGSEGVKRQVQVIIESRRAPTGARPPGTAARISSAAKV
jgi:hypothetical protein